MRFGGVESAKLLPLVTTSLHDPALQENRTAELLSEQLIEGAGVSRSLPLNPLMNWVLFFFITYID